MLRKNIKPVSKDVFYVEMLSIVQGKASVKLKQELVSKLQEIIASKDLDTKGIFATIVINQ